MKISKAIRDLTSFNQICLQSWKLSQILMVITIMLEKDLCAHLRIGCMNGTLDTRSLITKKSFTIYPDARAAGRPKAGRAKAGRRPA